MRIWSRLRRDMLLSTLKEMNISAGEATEIYFSNKRNYSEDEITLFLKFMYDIYSVIEHQKVHGITDEDLISQINSFENRRQANLISGLIPGILRIKNEQGYRDFTDQIVDALKFLKDHPEKVPEYKHILVDEYQDVNSLQTELLGILSPENLFAVGDPRQSIFGWRGSRVSYIVDFPERYPGCSVLSLTKNYRSCTQIVGLINSVIK